MTCRIRPAARCSCGDAVCRMVSVRLCVGYNNVCILCRINNIVRGGSGSPHPARGCAVRSGRAIPLPGARIGGDRREPWHIVTVTRKSVTLGVGVPFRKRTSGGSGPSFPKRPVALL